MNKWMIWGGFPIILGSTPISVPRLSLFFLGESTEKLRFEIRSQGPMVHSWQQILGVGS